MITSTFLARSVLINEWKQATGWIALYPIWIDSIHKVMMFSHFCLHTVERLTIFGVRLAAHCVADTSSCQQISLVSCVDKHFPRKGSA